MSTVKQKQIGRKPKVETCKHRYVIRLNDSDNAKFLSQFEAAGLKNKAHFIKACLFNQSLKIVRVDKGTADYYMRLTNFYGQFRAIGVNYNQVTKAIKFAFTEKKALAFLFKLEKATIDLIAINSQVIALTQEFEQKYLNP